MAYVTNDNLDKTYIDSLIIKANFTNVTSQFPGHLLAVQDLNNNVIFYNDFPSARDELILQFVIQQNS